jgi:hypothetical protein
MQALLAAAAAGLAVAASSTAATAQSSGGSGSGLSADGGRSVMVGRPDREQGSRRGHRRHGHRNFDGGVIIGDWSDGDWGRYNNRSFEFDSYNDWWHERPWRSYPRWVSSGTCDRMWWGGGTLRCSW